MMLRPQPTVNWCDTLISKCHCIHSDVTGSTCKQCSAPLVEMRSGKKTVLENNASQLDVAALTSPAYLRSSESVGSRLQFYWRLDHFSCKTSSLSQAY